MNILLLTVLLTRIPEGSLLAQWPESLNMRSMWRWNRGTVQAVETAHDLSYYASGCAILTVRGATLAGRTDLPGIAQDLLIDSDFAYVAAGSAGLAVLSLANPAAPQLVATLDLPGYAWSLGKSGSLVLVASGAGGLFAIDVARPDRPRLITQRVVADTVNAVVMAGGYAFVAAARAGLIVVDPRAPVRLAVVGQLRVPGSAQGITLRDSFAWVACGDSGVLTIDIARPDQPRALHHDNWVGALRTAVSESLGAVAAGADGVYLLDIRFPENPYLYRWFPVTGGFVQDAALLADTLIVAAGPAGAMRFGVGNPFLPVPIDTLQTPGYTRDVAVETSGAQAVAWVVTSNGLYAADLKSPTDPDLGFCPLRPPTFALALVPDAAVTLGGASSIVFVSTSDPAHPVIIDSLAVPGAPLSVAARDSWIWIGTADSEIRVVIRGPSGPARLADSLRLPGSVLSLHQTGNLLTAVVGGNGVCFCDVTIPQSPALLSYLMLPGPGRIYSACSRDTLAAACGDAGLSLIDVSNLRAPSLVRQVALAATGWEVALADTFCYIAEDWAGVVAFNVADPRFPWAVGYCGGPSVVHSLAMDGLNPIAGDVYSGLLEMELDLPYSPPDAARAASLLTPSVIASASITVEVPALTSPGTLSLFDPSGRKITQMSVPASLLAQEFQFPTDPLGAGVYFARLESRGQVLTTRIQVVR